MDPRDRIRSGRGAPGVERLQANLHGQAFAPHRHDTYAIGITLSGVQRFHFRGRTWHCLPGQCHVLHPDELHDGGAGTDQGFCYRIVYVDPALVRDALQGRALPFVADPVVDAARLPPAMIAEIWDIDSELDELSRIDFVDALSHWLDRIAARTGWAETPLALDALLRVRECIAATPATRHAMEELERIAGIDRWTLARQFRAAFGTSPSRFRMLRRLDHLRGLVAAGRSLSEAALDAGFADQAHMSRQFKLAYGLTPARWAAAIR
ncbi:AraC family transcriptional regulator [Noviherbaspirillum aerium]|uniref:AraC family transcriptional regulator n=1 Tax=Noviherbaspirillum aerium TaxID=2588497 RepID=UPI00124DC897|nr:AraC family transcriptional regulator [Noviherbaspirillum aerium]